MVSPPDDPVALYGTEEPVAAPIGLHAGALTAEFEAGNLRRIRYGAVEVIRGIGFLVRDRHWGTPHATVTDLEVDQQAAGFTVRYSAEVGNPAERFRYRVAIEGRENRLTFTAEGWTDTGFETNRTGFVVLHPILGVAGEAVRIEHVDGRVEHGRFPDLVEPLQPMMDLRAITHQAAPGVTVECRMEGDTFEMEDQRNWCDASYKTYVRPLAQPWPYRIDKGETLRQSVSLAIRGVASRATPTDDVIRISTGERLGPAPRLGLGFDPDEREATRRVLPRLAEMRPSMLVCHFDPRRGHSPDSLEAAAEVAAALGAEPWLEAVVSEVDGYEAEIAALGDVVRSLGAPFRTVVLSPAADLKSTPPGQVWPAAPPASEFYRAARRAFPGARLGGGMISNFTELNRKRPPLEDIDFVTFTTMGLVHAYDDGSLIEGLEALPAMVRTAQAIARDLPIVVGPSAVGLRMNPYGAGPLPNPENKRQAMAWNDPRQRSALGAVWALTHYARLAQAGIEAVAYGATTGPFGVVHTAQPWPTPGYEREGTAYPIFHVLRQLASWRGHSLRRLTVSAPEAVEGVAVDRGACTELLLANLTAQVQRVRIGAEDRTLGPFATHFARLS